MLVHVLQDKAGGITSIVTKLLAHMKGDGSRHAVLVDPLLDIHPRTSSALPADTVHRMTHRLPRENLFAVLRRLHRTIPRGPGILFAHDWLELAAAHRHDPGRTVVQVLHGDMEYYYQLAERHRDVVDVFVVCSEACQETLRARLPERHDDIRLVQTGVEITASRREAAAGPLRLCFCGRLDNGHKGVLDLPQIDAVLRARQVDVRWTVMGDGPDEAALRSAWHEGCDRVAWLGSIPNAAVREHMAQQDVLVLPSRQEGFPVVLLEAMATGLVPVVSDIRSGVPESVDQGDTGFRHPVGDIDGFAGAIQRLAEDRPQLERMSAAARQRIEERFALHRGIRKWDALVDECSATPRRPWRRTPVPYGSRLDRPWLPNRLVRLVRWRPGGTR